MYLQILKLLKIIRNLNNSKLSQVAGLSRAAVTKWFQSEKDQVNMQTAHIFKLAENLNIPAQILLTSLTDLTPLKTRFLWDSLYPDMESFVVAILHKRSPALARLVQVLGFCDAKKIAGKSIITDFLKYKKYLKPVRKKQLEILWPLYADKALLDFEKKSPESEGVISLKQAVRVARKLK